MPPVMDVRKRARFGAVAALYAVGWAGMLASPVPAVSTTVRGKAERTRRAQDITGWPLTVFCPR
jgi:hypothetical protein